LVLPKPGSSTQYYIFHESADWVVTHGNSWELPLNLSYSVVDMNLDSGRGAITNEKNIHAIDDTLPLGRITACKHANGRDWWIIVHQYWTDYYYKILLTPNGISEPYMQQIGFVHDKYDPVGQAIFSRDGSRYVYLSYDSTMEIMDFDRCTGSFSNAVTITISDSNLATLSSAFSPSGQYLYVSTNHHIYQYDTWTTNIGSTRTIVATYDGFTVMGFHSTFFCMQLAPDNKIYISTYEGTNVMHVINNPDQPGLACNLIQHHLTLPSYNAFGLPNSPNYDLGALSGSSCDSLNAGVEWPPIDGSVSLFPNPVSSLLYLRFTQGNNSIKNLKVVNTLGEEIAL